MQLVGVDAGKVETAAMWGKVVKGKLGPMAGSFMPQDPELCQGEGSMADAPELYLDIHRGDH